MEKVIEISELSKVFTSNKVKTVAVDSVDIVINKGDYISITGPSGSGKSSLLSILGLLESHSSGTFLVKEKDISGFSSDQLAEIRNRNIGFVFQNFNLLEELSVLENVMLPLKYSKHFSSNYESKAKDVLERVGLSHRLFHYPSELSGGQQQRVAIARALVTNPVLLLADEPTGNLDSKSSEDIMQLFEHLNSDGVTLCLVTHDLEFARRANKRLVMNDGRLASVTEA